MNTLELNALDAQNPLGFFAALGLLRIVDDYVRRSGHARPRLAFAEATYHARLHTDLSYEALKEIVLGDAREQANSRCLQLAYDKSGALCSARDTDATWDLKPAPAATRAHLMHIASAPRRDSDLAAGMFSELVQDNNGRTKPTAFHFTAGQQAFLAMVEALRVGIDAAALDEALLGPWRTASPLPSLSWDASVARLYALRASDPSGEKRGSVAAANWLGVHALALFPVVVQRGRLVTTAVRGGWKDAVFSWPAWCEAADITTVAALLRLDARRLSARGRSALGISTVFSCGILRSDQGGYGSFTPADVVVPPR